MLVGGCEKGKAIGLNWMFNVSHTAVKMTPRKEMGQKRFGFGITYDEKNREVYVFGGVDVHGRVHKQCEKYSIEKDAWTELEPMIKENQEASASIFNNEFIFVIGGFDDDDYLADIRKYSIFENSWEKIQVAGDQRM